MNRWALCCALVQHVRVVGWASKHNGFCSDKKIGIFMTCIGKRVDGICVWCGCCVLWACMCVHARLLACTLCGNWLILLQLGKNLRDKGLTAQARLKYQTYIVSKLLRIMVIVMSWQHNPSTTPSWLVVLEVCILYVVHLSVQVCNSYFCQCVQ